MFDVEGKWPNKVEQTGSTLSLSEIRTADKPPVHDIINSNRSNSFTISAGLGSFKQVQNIQIEEKYVIFSMNFVIINSHVECS